ncbi:endonuclease MutS2 [Alicyclobacillus cycloheptanicus]|uniref:Endonuclease MutS2 n=1 Tax=Alicyclobacillus cycloheptanicus TaxID=1457 RepID=A0ABT9XEN7_9BACL|nr:endonuclease MutS2 [Alicyclobacillus cycloheptanicus]MDQ0188758.1 DNA mismatch repair protein MutS2 [Alicyclobacillus cycloheptanicus]WDM00583.1 endonuclease MutS2 [Alicyclobacillus cycloheptanicus]
MDRALKILEFDRIKSEIQSYAACRLGREKLDELKPCTSLEDAHRELSAVDEALQFDLRFGSLPFGGVTDVRPMLKKAAIGGTLSASDLLAIANLIHGGRMIRQALEAHTDELEMPHLTAKAAGLFDARQTEVEIRDKVQDDATIADRASPVLQRLRQERRHMESRVRQVLEDVMRRHQRMLQEPVIALRGNSFCLPVRVEFKNQIPGVVHDVSSSGATVFIEPQAAVEASHRVQAIMAEEEREIERILSALSGVVAGVADALEANADILACLDAWFAKAAHANAHEWTRPTLRDDGVWKLRQAWHPLLDKAQAVPLDLTLGETFTMLLITGPNTGGKTVTLKTVGLLTLLAMSGCFVPARRASEIAWCDEVYVDIGDEQSIEQSLSTFSSHLRNIVPLFSRVTSRSLVLLDELGAGTDPTEGASLAMAILDELNARGCRVAVTTHYPELKAYAFREPNAVNASMEFDVETLRPTYRLVIGVPGRSNALAIAERLGLPRSVLERARSMLSTEDVRVEDLIAQMERARREAERAAQEALEEQRAAEQLRLTWEAQKKALDAEAERIRREAAEQARRAVERAQAEAERIIAELRKMRTDHGVKDHELVALRKQLEGALPEQPKRGAGASRAGGSGSGSGGVVIRPGAVVRVLTLGQKGEVLEVDGETLTVQMGALRTKVRPADVELLQNRPAPVQAPPSRRGLPKDVKLELDVRGELVEDAIARVEKYLDDAVLSGLQRVAVIHGKGTGALRDAIRRYLAGHRHVSTWAPGGPGEGGDGVTVVTLK